MSDNLNKAVNEAIATGKMCRDYDPVRTLQELRAAIGYNDGYVIRLGNDANAYLYRLLTDTISFHTGGDNVPNRT